MNINVELSRKYAKKINADTLQKRRNSRAFKMGDCYRNSFRMLSELPGSVYVEGVAGSIVPIEHSWLQYNDEIIDVTWVLDDSTEMESVIYEPYIVLTLSEALEYISMNNTLPIEDTIRNVGGIEASNMMKRKMDAYRIVIEKLNG